MKIISFEMLKLKNKALTGVNWDMFCERHPDQVADYNLMLVKL